MIGHELPEPDAAEAARDLMIHRGPDDAGSYWAERAWLASRRLAIIDVGDQGHQPFRDEESGVTIVFNGEIFNYIELRAQLEGLGHRFRSRSDTEVLLRSYLHWGSACVERLNGMWAFLVWDPRQDRAFFSRDRFGVKPLFMTVMPHGIAFASEPKVLLALYPQLRRPDELAVARLLAEKRAYVDGRSFYASISAFPAAHWGTYAPGESRPSLHRFWDFPAQDEHASVSWAEAQQQFRSVFEDSVRLRLRSDVPLGATLSGGLDSTAVVHAARRIMGDGPELRAYTAVFDGPVAGAQVDERRWARLALRPYRDSTLREVPAAAGDLVDVMRRIVWHMDGPGFSPAVFPLWQIMQTVRADGVKVLLEGQGADELLGGYAWHTAVMLLDGATRTLRDRSALAAAEVLRSARAVSGAFSVRRVLGDVAGELIPPLRRWDQGRSTLVEAVRPEFRPSRAIRIRPMNNGRDRLGERLLLDFSQDLLPNFLHYGDAISMAHSVESRLPFMDYRLVEICFRMPSEYKLRGGESKAVLREYLRAVGQQRIADRRRKHGYPTPTNRWLAEDGGRILREVLLDRDAHSRVYLVPKVLERMIDRHAAGMLAAGDVLFGLLSTELWLQECVYR